MGERLYARPMPSRPSEPGAEWKEVRFALFPSLRSGGLRPTTAYLRFARLPLCSVPAVSAVCSCLQQCRMVRSERTHFAPPEGARCVENAWRCARGCPRRSAALLPAMSDGAGRRKTHRIDKLPGSVACAREAAGDRCGHHLHIARCPTLPGVVFNFFPRGPAISFRRPPRSLDR